ncbi:hypothetical protein J6590_063944 [Homalodisca vitripennis]|nr:hypothetical protein J6590_063944 [Homalodisca vitripennis]
MQSTFGPRDLRAGSGRPTYGRAGKRNGFSKNIGLSLRGHLVIQEARTGIFTGKNTSGEEPTHIAEQEEDNVGSRNLERRPQMTIVKGGGLLLKSKNTSMPPPALQHGLCKKNPDPDLVWATCETRTGLYLTV